MQSLLYLILKSYSLVFTFMRTGAATGEDTSEAVGVEGRAENVFDLGLENARRLVTAQVRAGDGVIPSEAVSAESDFGTGEHVLHP